MLVLAAALDTGGDDNCPEMRRVELFTLAQSVTEPAKARSPEGGR